MSIYLLEVSFNNLFCPKIIIFFCKGSQNELLNIDNGDLYDKYAIGGSITIDDENSNDDDNDNGNNETVQLEQTNSSNQPIDSTTTTTPSSSSSLGKSNKVESEPTIGFNVKIIFHEEI